MNNHIEDYMNIHVSPDDLNNIYILFKNSSKRNGEYIEDFSLKKILVCLNTKF